MLHAELRGSPSLSKIDSFTTCLGYLRFLNCSAIASISPSGTASEDAAAIVSFPSSLTEAAVLSSETVETIRKMSFRLNVSARPENVSLLPHTPINVIFHVPVCMRIGNSSVSCPSANFPNISSLFHFHYDDTWTNAPPPAPPPPPPPPLSPHHPAKKKPSLARLKTTHHSYTRVQTLPRR